MSAIFGIFNKDGAPVDAASLKAMQQAMLPWGPDGKGIWCRGPIGLGHLLKHNTPESRLERQPTCHPAIPSLVISADARIDNRDELLDALNIPASDRQTTPDDVLILQAYERWGGSCVERLIGAFAFAIWDGRRRTLFCARDHVGFRPFYYFDGAQRFVLATDIKAVLAVGEVPQRLDDLFFFADSIGSRSYSRGRTAFLDIAKLLPAHKLEIRRDKFEDHAYWFPGREEEIHLASNADYAEALRERLQQAIACRLRSIHPIASHLSGGLDSSTITLLAARQLRAMGSALAGVFSWSPPPHEEDEEDGETDLSETEYARIGSLCRQEGLQCEYVRLTPQDVIAHYSRDVAVEPAIGLLHESVVQRRLVERGVGAVLSGWGGDEVLTTKGAGYLSDLLLRGRWRSLRREIREFGQVQGNRLHSTIKNQILLPLLPDRLYSLLHLDIFPLFRDLMASREDAPRHFTPEELNLTRRSRLRFRTRPGVRRNQLRELAFGHVSLRMEAWAAAGARRGIEYRYPLLDQRLLSLALRLPASQYFQQGWPRFAVRNAMKGILPDEIAWNRSKADPFLVRSTSRVRMRGLGQMMQTRPDPAGGLVGSRITRKVRLVESINRMGAARRNRSIEFQKGMQP